MTTSATQYLAIVYDRPTMEIRDIEIFLTLAEELHFGRTAERLHLTPARISQSIKKQERRIGAPLFERTTRRVALTPIGEQLRDDLAATYRDIQAAVHKASSAAQVRTELLTLGTMGALAQAMEHVLEVFTARHPSCELRYREIHAPQGFEPLRSGEVDIAVMWLPVNEPDLAVGPVVRTGKLVLMAAADHPLATRDVVRMDDLADFAVPRSAFPIPEYWEAGLAPFHTSDGRPIRRGPRVATWQEAKTMVASGECVTPIQAEAAIYYPWPGIVYLPIHDAPTYEWALVWRTAAETPLVRAFAEIAHEVGPMVTEPRLD
jgi:DNA-binding transcriptional LysR family regulator